MEVSLVHSLAEAGAAIETAMEQTESGSAAWTRLLDVLSEIERLIGFEVNGTWPQAS